MLRREMGEGKMSEITHPKLLITSTRADKHPMRLELFRNYRLPGHTHEENNHNGFQVRHCSWKTAER